MGVGCRVALTLTLGAWGQDPGQGHDKRDGVGGNPCRA